MADKRDTLAASLKKAMEAEIDGYHFYMMAAQTTNDEQGREVFSMLARDELTHVKYLKTQYGAVMEKGAIDKAVTLGPRTAYEGPSPIFSQRFQERIAGAHFEMSALSIGIQLEQSAVDYYKAQAEAADDLAVKTLYQELAAWEAEHHDALSRQLDAVKEDYWAAGGFSPF